MHDTLPPLPLYNYVSLKEQNIQDITENSRLRLRNLVMYCDVSIVHHQHLRMSLRTHLVNHVTLRKRHRLTAKEHHPFCEGL